MKMSVPVTNNEADAKATKRLLKAGHLPGSPEYEREGVCEAVTWPRTRCVIEGRRGRGTKLAGKYLDGRPMADGFEENAEYFRLDFLDPHEVSRGERFEAILPALWLMAGGVGERKVCRGFGRWHLPEDSPFGVLLREEAFGGFKAALDSRPDVWLVFLVTDSPEAFAEMAASLKAQAGGGERRFVQLYKSYLDNFKINLDRLIPGVAS